MPTAEALAALLCQIKDLRRAEYAICNPDGSVSVPATITCNTKRNFALTIQDYLVLHQIASCCDGGGGGGGGGGPTTNMLSSTGSVITSTVNGVSAVLDLAPMIAQAIVDAGPSVSDIAYDSATGVWTVTYADGTVETFTPNDVRLVSHTLDAATSVLTLILSDGSEVEIDLSSLSTITTLVDNGDGTYTYTSEDGTISTIESWTPANSTAADILALSQAVIDAGGSEIFDAFGVSQGVIFPTP